MQMSEIDKNFVVETKIEKEDIRFYDANEAPFQIDGVFYENGRYRRMPEAVADTVSVGVKRLHQHTAGGRVRFRTDSPYIAIHAKMPAIGKMPHFALTGSAGFDLYTRDPEQRYVKTFVPPFDITDGYESVIELGASQMREYVINLPLYSMISQLYIGLAEQATVEAPTPYTIEKPVVFYGSSITQGGCVSRPGNCYENILSRRFDMNYINLGFSGNGKAEPEIAKYISTLDMTAFVYDYDYNAPTLEHLENTHEPMFRTIRAANPNLPILMMSRPKYHLTAVEEKRSAVIRRTYENALASGDENVYYIDSKSLMQMAGHEGTVDNCHPNDLGFASMAQAIIPVLETILHKEQPKMKRILALLHATVLTLSVFAGCRNVPETPSTTTEAPEPFVSTTLIENGASDFVIIHDGSSEASDMAKEIRNMLSVNFDLSLEVFSAKDKPEEAPGEILVGNARQIAQKTVKKLTGEFDFAVKVEENKLVICSKNAISNLYLKAYLNDVVFAATEDKSLTLDSDDNIIYSKSELMAKSYVAYCHEKDITLDITKIFDWKQFENADTKLPYRLYVPFNYSPDKSYPLIVNLHGAGHRGNDNMKHLGTFKPLMTNKEVPIGDAIIIVPQCPENQKWVDTSFGKGSYSLDSTPESNELKAVVELIGQLQETYNVDAKRIYACGFSMGGYGTWNLLMNHPDLFAAGVAMCGAGDPSKANVLKEIPVWAVHGTLDPTVPVTGSRDMVDAIKTAGGSKINYTELADHEHDVWNYTYANTEIYKWLFEQSK